MVSQIYGCLSCGVSAAFDADEQKQHYKSEWHRYNLRRKINGLPCVPEKNFEEKLAASAGAANEATQQKQITFFCSSCNKNFGSRNSYENHLKSLKHAQNEQHELPHVELKEQEQEQEVVGLVPEQVDIHVEAQDDAKDEVESKGSWETLSDDDLTEDEMETWTPRCFICRWPKSKLPSSATSEGSSSRVTIDSLLAHLKTQHSFFIPQPEFVRDMKGLLCHLDCRVVIRCECLWCPLTFASTRAAQQHMLDKGHTKLLHEFPEAEEDEDGEIDIPRHFRYYDFGGHRPVVGPQFDEDGWSLVLPSGQTAGHRDLIRYYKQHLRAVPQGFHVPANIARLGFASEEEKRRTVISVVTAQQSRQLLLRGQQLAMLTPLVRANQRSQLKTHFRHQLRLGMNNNRLQYFFRNQHGLGWGE